MMVQGVRRREVLRRTLSLEMLERMGRELLARWRAVLLSLHRDRERVRRFVRAVQAQILISPSILEISRALTFENVCQETKFSKVHCLLTLHRQIYQGSDV
jgi:hypothetical protein